ncbi:hypothetical protein IFR05_014665 [Cadophora sp. M221]|nr:hypothetical protein IFR05_014665 [Cadophora sp. M221]
MYLTSPVQENSRKTSTQKKLIEQQQRLGVSILPQYYTSIRDRQKEPSNNEIEARNQRLLRLQDKLAHEQLEFNTIKAKDIVEFAPSDLSIDPAILEDERAFRIRKNPLISIQINSDSDARDDNSDVIPPSSPFGRMSLKDEDDDEDMNELQSSMSELLDDEDTRAPTTPRVIPNVLAKPTPEVAVSEPIGVVRY